MILDQHGQPIIRTEAAIQLRGGDLPDLGPWVPEAGWREGTPNTSDTPFLAARYKLGRAECRRQSRALYFTNGLFRSAVDITAAFLVGDAFTYGTFADEGLKTIVADFWEANSFSELVSERLITEWFLDGEIAAVFPTERNGDSVPSADEPALMGMLDVDMGGFGVVGSPVRGATAGSMVGGLRLETADGLRLSWGAGEFAWAANMGGLWNDPRGWSMAYPAAHFSAAYIAMLNMRLNVHHVQQRVLAVYKALIDREGVNAKGEPDKGVYGWMRKTRGFSSLPERGGVLPVVIERGYVDAGGKRFDAVEEDIKFLQPAQGAADAATDMRLILRMVGLTIGGLPEHYMGEGGNATRTTADSMGVPSVRMANKRQATLGALFTRLFRAEVRRRAPGRTFKVSKGSRKRLPIERIELPWVFPEIREETLTEIVARVNLALEKGLVSDETATGDLGYDPALEAERKKGQDPKPAPQATGGTPPPTDQTPQGGA